MIKKLLITYLFLITNVFAGLPPTTMRGQSQTLKPTTFNFQVPNKQATITAASTSLIETGNNNELENRGFEHTTVTTGWTISNATSSSSTTRIEGSKSLSLALTGALSLSQSSTINASQKSGVQMVASIWINSSDVSDLQLCSLKNGSEDKCTVTGGYVQGSGWRQLTVSFLGDSTSNGLKLKSTDTTGTVLVDQAYVGIGSPVVDFTPDSVYSAFVSSSNVVSLQNTSWISSASWSSGTLTITPVAGTFTVTPNCWAIPYGNVQGQRMVVFSETNSSIVFINRANDGTANANTDANVFCQKQGADYKTSKAYVASSSDTDWAPCTFSTLAWQGLGTVTNNLLCSRKGSSIKIKGRVTLGTVSSSQARIPLPTNFGTITTASNIPSSSFVAGIVFREIASANTVYSVIQIPSVSYLAMSGQLANTAINPNEPATGSGMFSNGNTLSIPELSIPIQGWTDSGVIVGSFQGYNETPGTSRVETFSVSYGKTATTVCDGTGLVNTNQCAYLDQIGNAVTSVTRGGTGTYVMNTSKTYSKLKCAANALNPIGTGAVPFGSSSFNVSCANCNSLAFASINPSTGSYTDSFGTFVCQGIPQ